MELIEEGTRKLGSKVNIDDYSSTYWMIRWMKDYSNASEKIGQQKGLTCSHIRMRHFGFCFSVVWNLAKNKEWLVCLLEIEVLMVCIHEKSSYLEFDF